MTEQEENALQQRAADAEAQVARLRMENSHLVEQLDGQRKANAFLTERDAAQRYEIERLRAEFTEVNKERGEHISKWLHLRDENDRLRAEKVELRLKLSSICEGFDMLAVEVDRLRAANAKARDVVLAVAPAVAILSRAEEVAPEIRAELAQAERLILAREWDALSALGQEPPTYATHRCKVCGAFWRDSGFGWSLLSPSCGKCCDNVPMGAQVEELGQEPAFNKPPDAEAILKPEAKPQAPAEPAVCKVCEAQSGEPCVCPQAPAKDEPIEAAYERARAEIARLYSERADAIARAVKETWEQAAQVARQFAHQTTYGHVIADAILVRARGETVP